MGISALNDITNISWYNCIMGFFLGSGGLPEIFLEPAVHPSTPELSCAGKKKAAATSGGCAGGRTWCCGTNRKFKAIIYGLQG